MSKQGGDTVSPPACSIHILFPRTPENHAGGWVPGWDRCWWKTNQWWSKETENFIWPMRIITWERILKKSKGLSVHICEIKDHTLKWHTHILHKDHTLKWHTHISHKVHPRYRVQIGTFKLNNRSQDSLWDLDRKVTLEEWHCCVQKDNEKPWSSG